MKLVITTICLAIFEILSEKVPTNLEAATTIKTTLKIPYEKIAISQPIEKPRNLTGAK